MIIYFHTKALQWEHRSLNVLRGANGFSRHKFRPWDGRGGTHNPILKGDLGSPWLLTIHLHPGRLTWNLKIT